MAVCLDGALHVVGDEPDDARASLGDFQDLDVEARRDAQRATRLELPTGVDHRLVAVVAEPAEEQHFAGTTRLARAREPRADDARRVEDEGVTGLDELHEVSELPVRDPPGLPLHHHEPALVPPDEWLLRDAVGGQLELVIARPPPPGRHGHAAHAQRLRVFSPVVASYRRLKRGKAATIQRAA